MVRFYEFSDLAIDEDLTAALDTKSKQLDNQREIIKNRKKALANRKAKDANRATVQKMATRSREST